MFLVQMIVLIEPAAPNIPGFGNSDEMKNPIRRVLFF